MEDETRQESVVNGTTIYDIPPEILGAIFLFNMVGDLEAPGCTDPSFNDMICVFNASPAAGPMLVSHVCRRWRQVAITAPFLWSSLSISPKFQLHTVNLWLERSGNLPLSILFHDGGLPTMFKEKMGELTALLHSLCQHIHRWKNIGIVSWEPLAFQQLLSLILPSRRKSAAVALQNLYISGGKVTQERSEALIQRCKFPPSTLRRFTWMQTLDSPSLHLENGAIWANLQEMALGFVRALAMFPILRACPKLVALTIVTLTGVDVSRFDWPKKPISMPHLQSLSIQEANDTITFCSALSAPRLNRLYITQLNYLDTLNADGFSQFLETSLLDTLSLKGNCRLPYDFEQIIQTFINHPRIWDLSGFLFKLAIDYPRDGDDVDDVDDMDDTPQPTAIPQSILQQIHAPHRLDSFAFVEHYPDDSYIRGICLFMGWGNVDFILHAGSDSSNKYPFVVPGFSRLSRVYSASYRSRCPSLDSSNAPAQ